MKLITTRNFTLLATALGALSARAAVGSISDTASYRNLQTPTTVLFETLDMDADGLWIHKSFINKRKETVIVPLDRNSGQYRQ
jgi:hypothetical protein